MDVEPTPGSVTVKVHFVDCGGDRGHDGAVDDQVLGWFHTCKCCRL